MCILCTSTLAELNSETEIEISECSQEHTDFPFLPNVVELIIRNSSIVFIPSLPVLKYLTIENSKIISLPEFPSLERLLLHDCYNLNKILYQPSLRVLSVADCYNLFSLPVLAS